MFFFTYDDFDGLHRSSLSKSLSLNSCSKRKTNKQLTWLLWKLETDFFPSKVGFTRADYRIGNQNEISGMKYENFNHQPG